MYGKFLLCMLFGVFAVSVHAYGQAGRMIKAGAKTIERETKTLPLVKGVTASPSVAREALRLTPSLVGKGDYAQKALRFQRMNRLLPSAMLQRFEHFQWWQRPMDEFIVRFKNRQIDLGKEASFLQQRYGKSAKFQGVFLTSFAEVNNLSKQAVKNGTDVSSALQKAVSEGVVLRDGFLTVAVAGNEHRPKDVLIYNTFQKSWVSLNQSKAKYLGIHLQDLRSSFRKDNLYWDKLLEHQGVVIRPDNYAMPQQISVSLDGVTWQEFDTAERMASQLWDAWNQNLFIKYDRHTRTAKFAADKESSELFSSVDNAVAFREARAAGVSVVESSDGKMIYFFDAERFPNMLVRLKNGDLKSMKMAKLTVGEDFPISPIQFMEELQKISASVLKEDPSRRMIFLEDVASQGDFYEVENCVNYLSKDSSFALPDLQDLQEFERLKSF